VEGKQFSFPYGYKTLFNLGSINPKPMKKKHNEARLKRLLVLRARLEQLKKNYIQNKDPNQRMFAELEKLYKEYYDQFQKDTLPCGWTWWSLPSKMWRVAKALGFENDAFNHEWVSPNIISGVNGYNASIVAQESALKTLRDKYPDSILLQNISSRGRLD